MRTLLVVVEAVVLCLLLMTGVMMYFGIVAEVIVVLEQILGAVSGIVIFLLLFGFASPLFIGLLVNHPDQKPKELRKGPYFFTYMTHNVVKIKVRGDRLIGMLMNNGHLKFKNEKPENILDPQNWEICSNDPSSEKLLSSEELLLELTWNPISWWAVWVYRVTGAIFTGIYPFQKLKMFEIRRVLQEKDKDGNPLTKDGKPVFKEVTEESDHLIISEFIWNFIVPSADTRDTGVKVRVEGALRVQCVNPYLTTWGTYRWDLALYNAIVSKTAALTRTKFYKEIQAVTEEKQYGFMTSLAEINDVLGKKKEDGEKGEGKKEKNDGIEALYGLKIIEVQIFDIEADTEDGNVKTALSAPWRAEQEALGIERLAKADAVAITKRANAINKGHEAGTLALLWEQKAKIAKAGANITFIEGGVSTDPAILAELQKLNRNK
ncbi:MAG: hypothetical protein AAB545_01470 [Patescibacteria group bacterium]